MFRPRFLAIFREHTGFVMCAVDMSTNLASKLTYKPERNAVSTKLHGVTHYRTTPGRRQTSWPQLLKQQHAPWQANTLRGQLQNVSLLKQLVHIVTTGLETLNSRLLIGLPFTDLRLSATSSAGLHERRSESVYRLKDRTCRPIDRPTAQCK